MVEKAEVRFVINVLLQFSKLVTWPLYDALSYSGVVSGINYCFDSLKIEISMVQSLLYYTIMYIYNMDVIWM